jgi:phosphoribosylglycinamide formyltransferase-1
VTRPLRIGALIGGGGRTLLNVADEIDAGRVPAEIACVISSRAGAPGVERARQRGFAVHVLAPRAFAGEDALHDAITRTLVAAGVDLVCLCGYLRLVRVDPPFAGRIVNIHPALLPDFGGRGMYGAHVHRAVLASRRPVSGCTVHEVDAIYDHGPIILQRCCPVLEGDTVETLAARVFVEESIAYPAAIRLLAQPGALPRPRGST